jgi:hypothetical protein
MSNQDQFSEGAQAGESVSINEFSTTRRVVTVGLVLVAAGLLGYVLYIMLMAETENLVTTEPESVPEAEVVAEPTSDETTFDLLSNENRTVDGEAETINPEDLAHAMANDTSTTTEELDVDLMLKLLQ